MDKDNPMLPYIIVELKKPKFSNGKEQFKSYCNATDAPVGVWRQRHKCYLKDHKRATYTTLFTSGKLNSYLTEIDEQAEEMFYRLVKQMVGREDATEQLKAENSMKWIGLMNNIRSRVIEVVNAELIYI